MSIQKGMNATSGAQNLGFVEFTSDLVRNVYTVITDAAIEQLKAYGEYVSVVAKPLSEYQKEVTGITFNDSDSLENNVTANSLKLEDYIKEVLNLSFPKTSNSSLKLKEDEKSMIENHFSEVLIDGKSRKEISDIIDDKGNISKIDLQKFVYRKLSKSTKDSYDMLVTILKIGMNKVEVTDGSIFTKLVFHVDASENDLRTSRDVQTRASSWGVRGSASARWGWGRANISGGYNSSNIKVNVVNEKSSSAVNLSADIIGSVKINFRSGYFPSYTKD